MNKLTNAIAQLWHYDWGLSVMAAALFLTVYVLPPLLGDRPGGGLVTDIFFLLALASGARVVLGRPALAGAVSVTAIACAAVKVGHRLLDGPGWARADSILSLAAMILLVWILSLQIPDRGPISRHHIQGGVALYLLLGLAWAQSYILLDLVNPDAFHVPEHLTGEAQRGRAFLYFSFVTLTTLGYGDVLPVSDWARSLATSESLTGQLFPAILLARLVSLHAAAPVEAQGPPGNERT